MQAWLRWAGSKTRSIGPLRPVFEAFEYDLYVEPFLGAGSVFLRLVKPVPSILNDTNRDLISFYRWIRDRPSVLWRELKLFPHRVTLREYHLIRALEERARAEKAAALEQLFHSRLSVLIGPAGTGKTTLLRELGEREARAAQSGLLLQPDARLACGREEQEALRYDLLVCSAPSGEKKRAEYIAAGIVSWQDGGGEAGTLIETRDEPGGALDAEAIARVIQEVLS